MKPNVMILLLTPLVCCSPEPRTAEKTVTPVKVATVELFEPVSTERYSASILPDRQVTLAFRVPGYVRELYQTRGGDGRVRALEAGDFVPAGAVLARLREDDYAIQVRQAQAALDGAKENGRAAQARLQQAQAGLIKAEADFQRAKALIESRSITKPDFDAAQAQRDSSTAEVAAVQAQIDAANAQSRTAAASLEAAQLAQSDTALNAPFSAAVVQRNIELGALVGSGTQAYSLADISSVKAVFGVPDSVAARLKPGTPVALVVEALSQRRFEGRVSAIAVVADRDTRLYQIEVSLPNPERQLRPGMIATLSMDSAAAPAPVPAVPVGAVIRDRQGGARFAVMVVENNVARERAVTLGPTFGERLAVTSGVNPGERVIMVGAALVTDGETVQVIP